MSLAHLVSCASRLLAAGRPVLLIGFVILSFAAKSDEDLRIDGSVIERGADGSFEAQDAQISKDGISLRSGLLRYDQASGIVYARSDVQIADSLGWMLSASGAIYRLGARELDASGSVMLATPEGISLAAEALSYSFIEETGAAQQANFGFTDSSVSLSAAQAVIEPDGYSLEGASYTTCKLDDPDWILNADSVTLDDGQQVSATGVKLEFMGVPVLYLPQLSFSIDDKRKSGFLPPAIRLVDEGFSEIDVSYYFNIAPNADATVGSRIISSRGPLVYAQTRLLQRNSYLEGAAGFISDTTAETRRYEWDLNYDAQLKSGFAFALVSEGVSDGNYPADFHFGDQTAQRHFLRSAALSYSGDLFNASLHADGFQSIRVENDLVAKDFARLPALAVDYARNHDLAYVQADIELSRFYKSDDPEDQNGQRVHAGASASRVVERDNLAFDMQVGVRGSSYSADQADSWASPHASLGASMGLERQASFEEVDLQHYFTPRVFLGLLPSKDFTDVPVYDTARAEFNVSHLYEIDSFVGGDRFGDASFVTFGFETGLWDPAANRTVLATRVAQRYLMQDSEASAGFRPPPQSGLSNALGDLRFLPTDYLMLVAQVEWSPQSSWEQINFEGKLLHPDRIYGLQYAFSDSDPDNNQGLISASMLQGITPRLELAAETTYSVEQGRLTDFAGGMQLRAACRCWSFDVLVRRELVATGETDTALVLQLSFKGLSDLGSRGYRKLRSDLQRQL